MAAKTYSTNSQRRRTRWLIVGLLLLAVAVACSWWIYRRNAPRVKALQTAGELCEALRTGDGSKVSRLVATPPLLSAKNPPEAQRELMALLSDEISPEGLKALQTGGSFGSLTETFPEEAPSWAVIFGVNADDCVAFRMERNGLRAELILLKRGESFVILRCNNVQQMAP